MRKSETRSLTETRDYDAEVRTFQRSFGTFGDLEKRTFTHKVGETRQAGTSDTGANDGSLQIVGYAAVFGKPSAEMRSQMGSFTEYIDPHAFDNVLSSNPDVLLTWDHDSRYVLGRTANGTLDINVEPGGLRYWSRVAPTSYAADLKVLMDGGYLDQSSFLFRVAQGGEEWSIYETDDGSEMVTRTITNVEVLADLCVCAAGMYSATSSAIARTLAYDYAIDLGYLDKRKARPSKAKLKSNTDEYRALGDVAWGPEEGTNDLMYDLETILNEDDECCWNFSVTDIAVSLDKAIVCDWDDYSYWVVPFTVVNSDPVLADKAEWVQVETAWVTTAEGYEANMQSAKLRREARMAEGTTEVEAPAVEAEAAPEVDVAAEVEVEAPAAEVEAPAVEAEAAPEVDVAAAEELRTKTRLLAEARARIARAKLV